MEEMEKQIAEENRGGEEELLERRRRECEKFLERFPELTAQILSGTALPSEVWERVRAGETLESAYSDFEHAAAIEERDAEIERLRRENEELKQQLMNAPRSTGSVHGRGEMADYDPALSGWNSID